MAKVVSPNEAFLAVNPVLRQELETRGIAVSEVDFIEIKPLNLIRDVVNQMYDYFPPTVQRAYIKLTNGQEIEIDPQIFPRQKGEADGNRR